jgi:chromosome segregation ATPase
MEINEIISEIERKSKRLLTRVDRLEKENTELRKSVFEYLEKLEKQKNEIETIKSQLKITQMSKSLPSEKKALQKEIDKYIYLIDKCIATVKTETLS